MKALVLTSGGVDSTTCLAMAVEKYGRENVVALSISYGQKHVKEIEASTKVAEYYGVEHIYLDLAKIFAYSNCSLLSHSAGTFMLLENQYNVGDIVEVNGFRGVVTSIGIRTTCITDSGDNVKIINNSEMKNILNRSDNFSKAVCDIAIPYETDLEKFEAKLPALLEEIFNRHKDIFKDVPVYLGVQALEESDILLRFVAPVTEKNVFSANRILNHDLLLGFRKNGVECPFPQLDVHSK